MSDLISRQDAIRLAEQGQIQGFEWQFKKLCELPSEQSDMAENLYLYKCYITDKDGLQHEVIHTGDIRRVTGWEI